MATFNVTFNQDYPPYAAGEKAGFQGDAAAALFVAGVGTLSAADQVTLAAQIAAAKAVNPAQPVTLRPVVTPDGVIHHITPRGLPSYGRGE